MPQRPALERLGQQRVIGIGDRAARDVPGLVPRHRVFVHEQAHQLGDRDRRMRVVELHGELLVEALDRDLLPAHDAQHVLQRAGHEEVLLLEAQLLAAGSPRRSDRAPCVRFSETIFLFTAP